MENQNSEFNFTYSAKEQEELRKIRAKYEPQEADREDKMEKLRRLDNSVTQKATTVSLVLGIIGALILGSGMSLIMTDVGEMLGLQGVWCLVIGIVIGIIGMVMVCFAYPVYNRILKKERARIAPEVLQLTDELIK